MLHVLAAAWADREDDPEAKLRKQGIGSDHERKKYQSATLEAKSTCHHAKANQQDCDW